MGARAIIAMILVLVPPVVMACGSSQGNPTATSDSGAEPGDGAGSGLSDGPMGDSNVDTSKSLSSLSPSDKQALCDWIAQQFGGYDSRGVCADSATGGLQGPTDQSECVVDLLPPASCPATVAELQSCIESEVQNACDWAAVSPTPACAFLTARACGGTSDAGVE